jgi:hypothetical protein
MRLSQLDYGSLLSYCPRGDSPAIQHARDVTLALKNDKFVDNPPILISKYIAQIIQQYRTTLPFDSFFLPDTILVPTPRSSPMRTPDTLWVPHRIAMAMVEVGLGKEVAPILVRTRSVPKAHLSAPEDRPTVTDHFESMRVQSTLSEPGEIVLIDDVVTQGATLLGAANRLTSAFPNTPIRAFAVIRTISNAAEFVREYDPCKGTITNRTSGHPLRRP